MKVLSSRLNIVLIISILALGMVGCRVEQAQGRPLTQSSPTPMVTAPVTPTTVSTVISEFSSATATTMPVKRTETERLTPTPTEEVAATRLTPQVLTAGEPIEFTLETAVTGHKMIYVGVGGAIDGLVNPDLEVKTGTKVHVTLLNGDGTQHNVKFPDFGAKSALVHKRGDSTEIAFEVGFDQTGIFPYFCTVPGHRKSGQEGRLIVSER